MIRLKRARPGLFLAASFSEFPPVSFYNVPILYLLCSFIRSGTSTQFRQGRFDMQRAINRLQLGRSPESREVGQYQPVRATLSQLEPSSDMPSRAKPTSAKPSQNIERVAGLSQVQPHRATSKKWNTDHTDVCEANVVWRDRPLCDAHAA